MVKTAEYSFDLRLQLYLPFYYWSVHLTRSSALFGGFASFAKFSKIFIEFSSFRSNDAPSLEFPFHAEP